MKLEVNLKGKRAIFSASILSFLIFSSWAVIAYNLNLNEKESKSEEISSSVLAAGSCNLEECVNVCNVECPEAPNGWTMIERSEWSSLDCSISSIVTPAGGWGGPPTITLRPGTYRKCCYSKN